MKQTENTPERIELKRLSRLAKLGSLVSFAVSFFFMFVLIMAASKDGMNLVVMFIAAVLGWGWYKNAQLFTIGIDMLKFDSFKDYIKHVEEEQRKDEEDF